MDKDADLLRDYKIDEMIEIKKFINSLDKKLIDQRICRAQRRDSKDELDEFINISRSIQRQIDSDVTK